MKRIGGLFDQIGTRPVLSEAFRRVAVGRRDTPLIREWAGDLDARLNRLGRLLREGQYEFGQYHEFRVRDGKSRLIHAPPLEQRIVHQAIVVVTGPALNRGAVDQTYAGRIGLGHRAALRVAQDHVRHCDWYYHADVARYYDSIPHDRLMEALSRRFRERRLLGLFRRLVESYQTEPGKGLPMGALTSQCMGNFYLSLIDHWALQDQKIGRYARYMYDLGVWGALGPRRRFR